MKKLAILAAFAAAAFSTATVAQDDGDMVCLITFASAEDAAAGADATALSGEYVTRAEAEAEAGSTDTVLIRNFDEEFCEGPTFNPDLRDDEDGVEATNSAKAFAPGQMKGEGESAKAYAPGQNKEAGEPARDQAPGQQKKSDSND